VPVANVAPFSLSLPSPPNRVSRFCAAIGFLQAAFSAHPNDDPFTIARAKFK